MRVSAGFLVAGLSGETRSQILPPRPPGRGIARPPLPGPGRVSAGVLVAGLSGNTRIQILPPRLAERVIAVRAASIWRAVIQAGSMGARPYSPKAAGGPPLA